MAGRLEEVRRETGVLPRDLPRRGPAIRVRDGGEGEVPRADATPGEIHGLSEVALLKRLSGINSEAFVAGVAAKTIAAYIDLNPVRAGMVKDPADYRWSSYGEAIGGGAKGSGRTARAGLVRALRAHQGVGADVRGRDQVLSPQPLPLSHSAARPIQ
jgi:hypothetical protein